MLRNKIAKIFSSRAFFIVFALLAAIALWMYVEYSDGTEDLVQTIDNIPIEFINMDSLRDRGLLIVSVEPEFMDITFEARRSILTRLSNNSVSVEIDLFNVTRNGHVFVDYVISLPNDINRGSITRITPSVERITLFIDRVSVRTIPVHVEYNGGTASEDLIADPVEFFPMTITVEGPEDVISRIDHANVPIFRENLSTTYIDDLAFVLIDEYGYELDESVLEGLTTSHDNIRVTVPIKQVKEIPLIVHPSHGAGSTDQNTIWSVVPPVITISGDPEALRDLPPHVLGAINMSAFSSIATEERPIVLPSHIHNDSGETMATIRVEVLGLDVVDYAVENLFLLNPPPGYVVEFVTTSVDVRLRGRAEDLEGITAMDIRVVADLSDLPAQPVGRHRLLSRVYIDGTDAYIGPIGETRISIRIAPDMDDEP
ncbi:MAG: hypothetical protein FWC66_07295 [Oscillospiraceae bacterium]|nr:hypothetical protein [Oscillospiraceae bacterium]